MAGAGTAGSDSARCQATWNRESWPVDRAARSRSCDTGLITTASAVSTGSPATSHAASDTPSGPAVVSRTRSKDAPTAWTVTPVKENGSRVASDSGSRSAATTACRTVSSSAGCTRY